MPLIIELLFLAAGLWVIITGKLPAGLFKFLFGKGRYELSSDKARLFGLLLISPLPVAFFVSVLLSSLLGSRGTGYAIVFEYIYIASITILSIVIARNARLSDLNVIDGAQSITPISEHKVSSYSSRLLIIVGIVVLGCITITSFGSLMMVVISSLRVGVRMTGNFWEDYFPFILMIVIIGIGLYGMVKLVQLLRKKA